MIMGKKMNSPISSMASYNDSFVNHASLSSLSLFFSNPTNFEKLNPSSSQFSGFDLFQDMISFSLPLVGLGFLASQEELDGLDSSIPLPWSDLVVPVEFTVSHLSLSCLRGFCELSRDEDVEKLSLSLTRYVKALSEGVEQNEPGLCEKSSPVFGQARIQDIIEERHSIVCSPVLKALSGIRDECSFGALVMSSRSS